MYSDTFCCLLGIILYQLWRTAYCIQRNDGYNTAHHSKSTPVTETNRTSEIHRKIRYLHQSTGSQAPGQRKPISKIVCPFDVYHLLWEHDQTMCVDKSLIIKELVESEKTIILVRRPRSWGKTLIMNMIRKFFEIEVDKDGLPIADEERENYKLFWGKPPLRITEYTRIISENQGKRPVVYLNLGTLPEDPHDNVEISISSMIRAVFNEYSYLRITDPHDKELFALYRAQSTISGQLADSLRFLTKLLFLHFQLKVYILIDEYDTPIYEAYHKRSGAFDDTVRIFRSIFRNAFQDNPYLEKALITGLITVEKAHLFPNVDNFAEYTILDKEFSHFHGYTSTEVDQLLRNVPTKVNPTQIKRWYCGYNYGEGIFYNPWSLARCFSDSTIQYRWLETGSTSGFDGTGIFGSEAIQDDLHILLAGGSVTMEIERWLSLSVQEIAYQRKLYSLLVFSGYLNPIPTVTNGNRTYHLIIPNQEVELVYSRHAIG